MAKSHYSVKKRKKELTRKLKQEQKRQRKLDKNKKKVTIMLQILSELSNTLKPEIQRMR